MTQVLDHGYVNFVQGWGSDEMIIEAARMSSGKGFQGWGGLRCTKCGASFGNTPQGSIIETPHVGCGGNIKNVAGDEKLLAFLWKNHHMTPFEMAGAIFEVKAPIFVFREWHRHRTQSYNEASARYIQLPDENYTPTMDRIKSGVALAANNRQAQGAVAFNETYAQQWLERLQELYDHAQSVYELGINSGVPKELARLPMPVARYSRMRASSNLRNWLQFLELRSSRTAPGAQWEIRQFADAVEAALAERFPRTMKLFMDGK